MCQVPGIVGVVEVVSDAAYPDPSQFDSKSDQFDPNSTPDKPRCGMPPATAWLLLLLRVVMV